MSAAFCGVTVLSALLLPGGGDDFFFALRDVVLIAAHAAAPAASSSHLLRLGEFALERIGLDEEHVGARFRFVVLRRGVNAHQVAGNELEILQSEHGRAIGFFCALLLEQIDGLLGAAIYRIVQREFVQAKITGGFRCDGDFLDRARAIVTAGTVDGDLRRIGLARFDEEIAGEADGLAVIDGGDVIFAVLIHVDRAPVEIALHVREAEPACRHRERERRCSAGGP